MKPLTFAGKLKDYGPKGFNELLFLSVLQVEMEISNGGVLLKWRFSCGEIFDNGGTVSKSDATVFEY
jgi:hypothetical protein